MASRARFQMSCANFKSFLTWRDVDDVLVAGQLEPRAKAGKEGLSRICALNCALIVAGLNVLMTRPLFLTGARRQCISRTYYLVFSSPCLYFSFSLCFRLSLFSSRAGLFNIM